MQSGADGYSDTMASETPLYDGQPIFGGTPSFTVQPLQLGTAAAVDAWLGLTPGTTHYGAPPSGGRLWGITGALEGSSVAAVQGMSSTLLSYAGLTVTFGQPTGLP
jgi:hypothetical protein